MQSELKVGRFLFGSFVFHDTLDIFQNFWLPTINALFWKAKQKNTEMRRYWIAKWWRFLTWMVVLCKCSHIPTHTYTSYLLLLSSFPYAVCPCGCLFNPNSASYNSGCAKYLKFLAWQMQSLVPLFINCNYFHIAFKEYSYTILI